MSTNLDDQGCRWRQDVHEDARSTSRRLCTTFRRGGMVWLRRTADMTKILTLITLLLATAPVVASDPSTIPIRRADGQYDERYRVRIDLNGDARPDLILSQGVSEMGNATTVETRGVARVPSDADVNPTVRVRPTLGLAQRWVARPVACRW